MASPSEHRWCPSQQLQPWPRRPRNPQNEASLLRAKRGREDPKDHEGTFEFLLTHESAAWNTKRIDRCACGMFSVSPRRHVRGRIFHHCYAKCAIERVEVPECADTVLPAAFGWADAFICGTTVRIARLRDCYWQSEARRIQRRTRRRCWICRVVSSASLLCVVTPSSTDAF